MLRLDPSDSRIRTAREFKVWEAGAEYNVARGLKKVFGLRTSHICGFVDNDVGHLLADFMSQGGVDYSYSPWVPFDGIGRAARIGLNFTERGFGVRAPFGMYDRGHSASSQIQPDDINWEAVFEHDRTRWFHTGGIFTALSDLTPKVISSALSHAKRAGAITSYDMNFRPSLWKASGGADRGVKLNRDIVSQIDVLFGGVDDFQTSLGMKLTGIQPDRDPLDTANIESALPQLLKEFPNLKLVATTQRGATSATKNDWSAVVWSDGKLARARQYRAIEIYDRIGGGDGFASGVIFSFLTGRSPQEAVELGTAHGALAMTTPGDNSMASLSEVLAVAAGSDGRVQR